MLNCKNNANKSNHPFQNRLLLITEPRTRDNIVTAVTTKSTIYRDVTPCSRVVIHQPFKRTSDEILPNCMAPLSVGRICPLC
jgi:hypothetical protein